MAVSAPRSKSAPTGLSRQTWSHLGRFSSPVMCPSAGSLTSTANPSPGEGDAGRELRC